MVFTHKLLTLLTLVPVLFLSACGDKTPEKILIFLESNQLSEAASIAQDALTQNAQEGAPEAPFYHGVMAEVLTRQCVRRNCPATEGQKQAADEKDTAEQAQADAEALSQGPSQRASQGVSAENTLSKIRQHLENIKEPIALSDEKTIDFYRRLIPITERFISIHHDPQSYTAFVSQALPNHAQKSHFLKKINKFAQKAMANGNLDEATSFLQQILELGEPNTPLVNLTKFMLEFTRASGNPSAELQATVSTILQNNPNERAEFIANIPHIALIKARRNTENAPQLFDAYKNILRKPFTKLQLKKLNKRENKKILANEIFTLSQNKTYLEQFTPEDKSARALGKVKASLLKVALQHDPKNNRIWDTFFPLAVKHLKQENGSLRAVYGDLDLAKISKEVVIKNNNLLLEKARKSLKKGKDITFYLQEVIYRRDANQEKVDQQARALLSQALTRAMSQNSYKQAMNYLRLMPDPPEDQRNNLKQLLKEALDKFWQDNAFREMEEATQYMRDKLNASINLDVELMTYLRAYLNSDTVTNKLRTNSPAPLLKPADAAKVELGPKMTYARKRFSNRPEIIQARLKSLAINLDGRYSTANVLHSLRHLFTDEKMDELITNSIKSAMVDDSTLTPAEFASYGERFKQKWPDFFTINFIVSESLERVNDVDQAKKVWQQTSPKFHDFAAKLRPQLTNLLKGVQLFEQGEQTKAANIFAKITDPVYRKEAKPYLERYGSLLQQFKGTYIYQGANNKSPIALLHINGGGALLSTEIEAVSHLGMMESDKNLTKSRGGVARVTLKAEYNTADQKLRFVDLSETLSNLNTSKARVFSKLTHLTKQNGNLFLHLQDGTKLTFTKLSSDANFTYLTSGRYGITEEVRTVTPKSYALPVGSILSFSTQSVTRRQRVASPLSGRAVTKRVHPVNGTLRHPAMDNQMPLSGFLDPEKNTLHLNFTYTFNDAQTVFNGRVRCQPLGKRITCASHNQHERRKLFTTVVAGRKIGR